MRIALEQVRIASPCDMRWEDLTPVGDGRAERHCGRCRLNVHDTSAMTEGEIRRALLDADGRWCARLRRRADGRLLIRDCPVGLRAARARVVRLVGRLAAAVLLLLSGAVAVSTRIRGTGGLSLADAEPFAAIARWLNPNAFPVYYDTVGSIDLQSVLQSGQGGGGQSPFKDDPG